MFDHQTLISNTNIVTGSSRDRPLGTCVNELADLIKSTGECKLNKNPDTDVRF